MQQVVQSLFEPFVILKVFVDWEHYLVRSLENVKFHVDAKLNSCDPADVAFPARDPLNLLVEQFKKVVFFPSCVLCVLWRRPPGVHFLADVVGIIDRLRDALLREVTDKIQWKILKTVRIAAYLSGINAYPLKRYL